MWARQNAYPEWCEYCGVAVGREISGKAHPGYRYADGRAICTGCHASAIKTAEQLRAVWRRVARTFDRLGLTVDWEHLPVQMLDKPVLQREAGFGNVVGLAHSLSTALTVTSHVAILYGMPALLAAQTLGHESGHVWCREQRVRFDPPEREEGFANVLACLVLQEMPGADAREKIERLFADTDPVYGGLFREEWALLQQLGWEPYLERVRTANQGAWHMRWFGRRRTAACLPRPGTVSRGCG